MIKLDWRQFGRKYESLQTSFELLCHYLFCRELKITHTISADFNQKGLETNPVKYNDKLYGYQAKFFEKGIKYNQIEKSIKNALEEFEGKLDYIFIYLNTGAKTSCDSAKRIVKIAKDKGVDIIWKDVTSIETMLSQPCNIDLAQLFFGVGDEFKFIKENTNWDINTLLQSNEYLNLPIIDERNNKFLFDDIPELVINDQNKAFMIIGNPGSGKSVCMHKFFQSYAGLDKKDEKEMLAQIGKNNAIPMLINLKYCSRETLENIIRNRQMDYKVNSSTTNFIYLLDGLDEITDKEVEVTFHYIRELIGKPNTSKVIISSRKESLNRFKIKSYLPNIKEYIIGELNEKDIQKYFEAKNDDKKLEALDEIKRDSENQVLFEIKDILLIKSLWDIIDKHNIKNCIFDIIKLKVNSIIDMIEHQKILNQLNIPNPKKDEIIELNKIISYEMQKDFVLSFSYRQINNIVLNRYPRIDYKAANEIVAYLTESFFENNYNQQTIDNFSYIYQHRRFQEYFFTLKLREEYEITPNVLRKFRILSNRKFFENFFLKLLREEYLQKNDLAGILELNLINVYLGKNKAWGADEPFYLYSDELTKAIATQKNEIFESLITEESLPIAEHLNGKIYYILNELEDRNKNSRYLNRIPDPIEEKIESIIRNIVICWKNGKYKFATDLDKKLQQLLHMINLEYKEYIKLISKAIINEMKNYLYILLVIREENPLNVLNNFIRKKYTNGIEDHVFIETHDQKLIKSFLKVILDKNCNEIVKLIPELDDKELIGLLELLCTTDHLHLLIQDNVTEALSNKINKISEEVTLENNVIIAFKKYLGLKISKKENDIINEFWDTLNKERPIDLFTSKAYHEIFSFITIAGDKFSDFMTKGYQDVRTVYIQLYKNYFEMLTGKISIGKIVKKFCGYNDMLIAIGYTSYKYFFTKLWANIFLKASIENDKLPRIKEYLLSNTKQIDVLSLFCKLKDRSDSHLTKLVHSSEIEAIEDRLLKNGPEFMFSIEDNVNSWFKLAYLYSEYNIDKSINCIAEGINKGILRHGWRKDTIVDCNLIDAFKIMVDNKFLSIKDSIAIARRIFEYLIYLGKVTDDSGNWRAFKKLLKITSKIDIKLAEEFLLYLDQQKLLFNDLVTVVLIEKVYKANSLNSIQKLMNFYKLENDSYYGKRSISYHLEKLKVYLEVLESGLYEEDDEKKVFDMAFDCVDNINKYGADGKIEDLQLFNTYKKYCKVYGKECNMSFQLDNDEVDNKSSSKFTDEDFKFLLSEVLDASKLDDVYKKLREPGTIIKEPEIWRELIDKTYNFTSSLGLFTDYLKNIHYAHISNWSSNSEYVHFGVAYAMSRAELRQEMLKFIYENSGHDAFYTLIKVNEINKNKEECIKLFNRFIRFCDFLVYG